MGHLGRKANPSRGLQPNCARFRARYEYVLPRMQIDFWELEHHPPSRRDAPVELVDYPSALRSLDAGARSALERARARAGFGRSHLLELVVGVPWNNADDAAALAAVEELLALQLGEDVLDAWVGTIDIVPIATGARLRVMQPDRSRNAFFPIETLASTLVRAVSGLREGLPDRPCHERCDHEPWVMFELTPELDAAGDYSPHPADELPPPSPYRLHGQQEPPPPQHDLVTATTWMPEMLRCLLRGDPFYSGRFTRQTERFYYLEIEDGMLPHMDRLERRVVLEDALNSILRPLELGCVVGGGIGLLRSYIDLALIEPKRAIVPLTRVVEHAGVDRAWLRAADSEYAEQRLPLHEG